LVAFQADTSELSRVHRESVAGLRRDATVLRKEVVLTNNNIRELVKKTNDIATVADQLAVAFLHNRRLLTKSGAQLTSAVAERATSRDSAAAAAGVVNDASAPAPTSSIITVPPPRTQEEMEKQDAAWVIVLKPVLYSWVEDKLVSAYCAAHVWLSMAEVNVFLRDWVMARFNTNAKEAVRMLTRRWLLPTRPSKKAAERAAVAAAAGAPKPNPKMTAAYRYLHRVVYHFYEGIGIKTVSVFATYVNENGGRGTLRRARGTSTKLEVYFKPKDAAGLLQGNLFLKDANCVAGLVRALVVVFSGYGVLHKFSEPSPTAGGPRTLVFRNAYIAMVATKVRAHLSNLVAAKDSDDEADDEEATDGEGGMVIETGQHLPVAESGTVLNSGHRTEWEDELVTTVDIFRPWGTGALNGLRISDASDASRADATRPPTTQQQSPSAGATPGAAAAAADTAAAAASRGGSAAVGGVRPGGGEPTAAADARLAGAAEGGSGSAPTGPTRAVSNGSDSEPADDGRTNVARTGFNAMSGPADPAGDGNSTDGYTSTTGDEEEPPARRLRTPAEAAAAAANRAARRVLMHQVD